MKIRSQTELVDFLDRGLASRKRELTTLALLIKSTRRQHERDVLLRASIPLLYAHWEGYIKIAALAYLEYVSRQGVVLKQLRKNFVALACRGEFVRSGASKRVSQHSRTVGFLLDNLETAAPLNHPEAIDTGDNLKSQVLSEIMFTIGIEYGEYWRKKELLIDFSLLKHRNEIAHGEMVPIDSATHSELHGFVVEALDRFKTDIENAALQKAYLA